MGQKTFSIIVILVFLAFMLYSSCSSGDKKKTTKAEVSANLNDTFRVRQLTDIKFEATTERLKRGGYLANGILMCFTCHSPRNWDSPDAAPIEEKKGSGGTIVNKDSSSLIIAPNITPDKETGAGTWTDDMFARAIREGVGHDGRALSWQMPYNIFRKLSDEDLASVIVYLRSLPPLHNVVPATVITAEERSGTEKSLWPVTEPVPTPDLSDPVKRGMYLVSIGECVGCHTSHSEYNPGLFGGGNLAPRYQRVAFSANITKDPSGIDYGPDAFIFTLRTGKGGTLSPVMPWVAFKNISDDDLKAIYAYLKTLPPSKHYVSNQKPFTLCAICGLEHGLGEKNKRIDPSGIKANPALFDLYAGTYYDDMFGSSYIISREGNKLIGQQRENGPKSELVPQSENRFIAGGWVLPINFNKDKDGRISQLTEETDYGRIFKKIK